MRSGFVAGVELGGMSCCVAIAHVDDISHVIERHVISTSGPEETLSSLSQWLKERLTHYAIESVGIACFGPLTVDKKNTSWGVMGPTPKPHWKGVSVVQPFFLALPGVNVFLETDVNAPAAHEAHVRGAKSLCYITVGTGVGVGVVAEENCIHGHSHPEAGHIPCFLHESDKDFSGDCPFHRARCIEGVLRASALARRANIDAHDLSKLPDDHFIWSIASFYCAQLCLSLALTCCPQRIVIGGGMFSNRPKLLLPMVREHFQKMLNGYVENDFISNPDTYIVSPSHGSDAGLIGALYLAAKNTQKK